jgi:hypothetical protein
LHSTPDGLRHLRSRVSIIRETYYTYITQQEASTLNLIVIIWRRRLLQTHSVCIIYISSRRPSYIKFLLDWQAGTGENHGKWACQACRDSIWRDMTKALRHEARQTHQSALQFRLSNTGQSNPSAPTTHPHLHAREAVHGPLYELLHELSDPEVPEEFGAQAPNDQEQGLDWDAMENDFDGGLALPHAAVAALASSLEEWLVNEGDIDNNSEDNVDERSDESSPEPRQAEEQESEGKLFPATANSQ